MQGNAYVQALEFLVDAGVDTAVMPDPYDRFDTKVDLSAFQEKPDTNTDVQRLPEAQTSQSSANSIPAQTEIIKQAIDISKNAKTLEDLKKAIETFEGLEIKKNATNMVFADGNPQAKIMVIGEAPGDDEDRQGKPFVGVSGQLLDRIFDCIGLSRQLDDVANALYITNILNWRPPGNRTPTAEEMAIAKPLIERHIELVNPEILVLCGGVAAQTLLNSKDSISRLRGTVHDYSSSIKAIATYHPAFLLRTPLQKKKVWDDMILLKGLINEG